MHPIGRFLERTYKKIKGHRIDQEVVLKKIANLTTVILSKENIEIKGSKIYLTDVPPTIRSEIFFYKKKIIDECRSSGTLVSDIN